MTPLRSAQVTSPSRAAPMSRPESAECETGARVMHLQRAAGNRAVADRLVAQRQNPATAVDQPLGAAQVQEAVRFYTLRAQRYSPEIISRIQGVVGAPVTGTVDDITVQAVARWQRDNGSTAPALTIDGIAGPRALPRMFPGGLSAPGHARAFGERAQDAVIVRWHNLTPTGRAIELARLVNETLEAAGVPPVTPEPKTLGGPAGAFHFSSWHMQIDVAALRVAQPDRDQAAKLVSTVYHEARHAEQWFRMARMRAAKPTRTSRAIAAEMQIPPRIAERAKAAPLPHGSMEALIAQGWFDSVYGPAGNHRNAVLNEVSRAGKLHDEAKKRCIEHPTPANEAAEAAALARFERAKKPYRELPEENDAVATETAAGAGVTRGAPDPVTDLASEGDSPDTSNNLDSPGDALTELFGEGTADAPQSERTAS